jgi:hypothetical protein
VSVKRREPYWRSGERARLAKEMNIEQSHLSQIINRKRGVSKHRALILEYFCKKLFRKKVPMKEWLFNKESLHPAFIGESIKHEQR